MPLFSPIPNEVSKLGRQIEGNDKGAGGNASAPYYNYYLFLSGNVVKAGSLLYLFAGACFLIYRSSYEHFAYRFDRDKAVKATNYHCLHTGSH